MKYSILVKGTGVCYVHQSGHTKEKAEQIAELLNNAFAEDNEARAFVMTDEEAQKAIKSDTTYFAVLEDGCVAFIEITPEMWESIDKFFAGDEEAYFAKVVCEKYNISYNNCQWSLVCESCITCYGKKPQIL